MSPLPPPPFPLPVPAPHHPPPAPTTLQKQPGDVKNAWETDGVLYRAGAAVTGVVGRNGAGLYFRHHFQVRSSHVLHHRWVL